MEIVVFIDAGKAFHDMAEDAGADRVGLDAAVEIGRLGFEDQRDGAAFWIDAFARPFRAPDFGEKDHDEGEDADSGEGKQKQLLGRSEAAGDAGVDVASLPPCFWRLPRAGLITSLRIVKALLLLAQVARESSL
jgi:hypothetical protein